MSAMPNVNEDTGLLGRIRADFPSASILLFLFAVTLVLRASTLVQQVVNIDEPQLVQFALNMIQGDAPYTTMIGEKPFFYYLFYYIVLSVFGSFNLIAVHAVTIVWVTLTAAAVFMILRRLLGREGAISGALIFTILTTLGDFKIIASDGETLMNLPMCLATYFFLAAVSSRKIGHFLLAGLFVGLAGQFRYQAGIQLATFGSYLVLYEPWTRTGENRRARLLVGNMLRTLAVAAAFVSCYGVVLFILWLWGSLDAYLYWTLEFELSYIKSGMDTINPWKKGFTRTALLFAAGFVVWVSAITTAARVISGWRSTESSRRDAVVLFMLWFVCGFVAVSVGGRFAIRYYTQIYPPLALLAAVSFPYAWFRWQGLDGWRVSWKRWALIVPALGFWVTRFFSPWILAAVGELDYAPFQKEIGSYIERHSETDEKIFIWGWGNGIYVYAKRYPATRFITSDFLTGRIPGSPTARDPSFDTSFNIIEGGWDMFMGDMKRDRPVYILDTSPADIHDYAKYPIGKFPLLKNYIDENYAFETRIHDVDLYRRVKP